MAPGVQIPPLPLRVNLVDWCDGIESSILSSGNDGSNPSTLKLENCPSGLWCLLGKQVVS